jgi:hypothetical protein
MKGRYAQIKDNIVMNVVMYDPVDNPLANYYTFIELPEDSMVSAGYAYIPETGEFEYREGQVPQTTVVTLDGQ